METTDKTDKKPIKKEAGEIPEVGLKFLETLALDNVGGNITLAAEVAGVGRQYMYQLRAKIPEFKIKWDATQKAAKTYKGDVAEIALMKAVRDGNITAIIFALKKYNPEEFGDHKVDRRPEPVMHKLSPELQKFFDKLCAEGNGFGSNS